LVALLPCSTHQVVIGVIFHRIHNTMECSKWNQANRKTTNRTNANRNRKKLQLVWIYSDHIFTQLYGLIWFADFIFSTKSNQTAT